MNMLDAVTSVFANYANFKGRARRSEYWWFMVFNSLVYIVLGIGVIASLNSGSDGAGIFGILMGIYSVGTILPGLAVACRRLHDIGKSGAYIFFLLLPAVGEILLLVWEFQDGEPWENQYGPDPKGRSFTAGSPYRGLSYGGPSGSAPSYRPPETVPSYGPITTVPDHLRNTGSEEATKHCPNCGAVISMSAQFCKECGSAMRREAPPAEPSRPVTYPPVSPPSSGGFSAPSDSDLD